jgi:hypothetical protein
MGYGIYSFLFRNVLPPDLSALLIDLIGMRLLVAISSLVCIFGLLRFARWGRKAAVSWNLSLFFLLGVLPFVGGLFAAYLFGGDAGAFLPKSELEFGSLTVAVVFLVLALALRSKRVREYFESHA